MNVDYYYYFPFVPVASAFSSGSRSCYSFALYLYSIYLIMFALVFLRCFWYYCCCHLPFTDEHYLIPFSITITLYDGARFIMMVFYCLLLLPLSPLPIHHGHCPNSIRLYFIVICFVCVPSINCFERFELFQFSSVVCAFTSSLRTKSGRGGDGLATARMVQMKPTQAQNARQRVSG